MNKIDDLLLQWKQATLNRLAVTDPIQAEIDRLTAQVQEKTKPFDNQLAALESEIRSVAMASASGHEAHGVKVSYRKGYERANWDGKALAGYAVAHPEILLFQSVTQVAPAVSIKAAP